MEWLVFLGLAAILWKLWQRVQALEERLAEIVGATADFPPAATTIAAPQPSPVWEESLPVSPLPPPSEVPHRTEEEPAAEGQRERFEFPRLSFDFEDMFGRRLPIWTGGIALALAGIFLVRFSIEAGLLTPPVRVALSFLFGLALLAGAEAAYRFEQRVADPRVRQALAGAGLATLYAGFYLAGSFYGLIGSAAAFLGLAVVTAAAIVLSYRFGLPSAVLGLVGGFAAPALVGSEEANVPLLTLYLALVTAGLAYTGRRQDHRWLGYAALAGGLLWGGVLLIADPGSTGDLLSFGIYLALLGTVIPLVLGVDSASRMPRLVAAGLATLQMAALVDRAGSDPLTWGLYLLLAAALAALGWRERDMRDGEAVAAAIGFWLLLRWGMPAAGEYVPVASAFAAIFLLVPLALLWLRRARQLDLWQVSLVAPALAAVNYWHFGAWTDGGPEPVLALATAVLAAIVALAGRKAWLDGEDRHLLTLPLASAALLAFASLLLLVPAWAAPLAGSAVAGVLVWLATRRRAAPMHNLCWAAAIVVTVSLLATPGIIDEMPQLAGLPAEPDLIRALLRWAATALPFAAIASLEDRAVPSRASEALTALLVYGLLAQVLPSEWLAWTAAAGAFGLSLRWPGRSGAWSALLAVALLWAFEPLTGWAGAGLAALFGDPMIVAGPFGYGDALLYVAPFALAACLAWWFAARRAEDSTAALLVGGSSAALVAVHIVYKQLFAIEDLAQFQRLGLPERTVWEALLMLAALALTWRLRHGRTAFAAGLLLAASLAHFAWFTLMLHNPLLAAQEVGSPPVVNWLLPAYGSAWIGLVAARRIRPNRWAIYDAAFDAALMALIAVFALSELRQVFSGSLLTQGPVTQSEDLLRSLLGIVLAIVYLFWGSRTGQRSWRIGSLLLMLLAVFKVFLIDTAGLEGLLRIASFMALGFSLIGIGWVYSRQLGTRALNAAGDAA